MNVKGDDPESTHRRNLPAFQGIGSVIKTKEKGSKKHKLVSFIIH